MGLYEFLVLLLVGGIIGALGQAIAGYSTPGCAMSIVIGFVGALIGRWIQTAMKLPSWLPLQVGDTKISIVWAVIGSALLVLALRLVLGRRATTLP